MTVSGAPMSSGERRDVSTWALTEKAEGDVQIGAGNDAQAGGQHLSPPGAQGIKGRSRATNSRTAARSGRERSARPARRTVSPTGGVRPTGGVLAGAVGLPGVAHPPGVTLAQQQPPQHVHAHGH